MREQFIGYHKPKKDEISAIWEKGIFAFDTSVLLNIYRYTDHTREDFFKILDRIKNRVWLPYQVAFEYHEQRENVISQQNNIYEEIEEIKLVIQRITDRYKKGHPFANMQQIKEIFNEAIDKSKSILNEAQSKLPDLLEEDIYLEQIIDLFDTKIGKPYTREKTHQIYEIAEKRFKEKIPPGYEDTEDKKGLNRYGDVILWLQLIEHATSKNIPIIFVTDETKGDWWRKDRKGKILAPRPELKKEFQEKTMNTFHMYLAEDFIKNAQINLNIQISPGTVKEAKEVRQDYETKISNYTITSYEVLPGNGIVVTLVDGTKWPFSQRVIDAEKMSLTSIDGEEPEEIDVLRSLINYIALERSGRMISLFDFDSDSDTTEDTAN